MIDSIRIPAREAIIQSAFTVLGKNPRATLADVAARAGVGRATLHRHFASREDLTRELALLASKQMDRAVDAACAPAQSYSDAVRLALRALIPLGDRRWFLTIDLFADDPELQAEFARQNQETTELIDAAKHEGLFDKTVPTSWIVQAFDHLLFAGWEGVSAGELTEDQAADLAWRTLVHGLGRAGK